MAKLTSRKARSSQSNPPNRINGRGRPQGRTRGQRRSAFHELVVLPTLAPQLARPYRVPGTDKWYNLEFLQEEPKGTLVFSFRIQICANVFLVEAIMMDREQPNSQ